ncbi:COP9 signalosome complex subunit 8-like [Symsagittifera roscoffensis]|uniref:COP9 signalosome complex subunit 8-like n=1 Tax=Symsagittifera roscoffensis TaxID=84072 RepID=UPI00307CB762
MTRMDMTCASGDDQTLNCVRGVQKSASMLCVEGEGDCFSVVSLREEASILEEAELSLDVTLSQSGMDPNAYSRLYAIYLILGDLTAAKFLWRRLPPNVRSLDEMSHLRGVGLRLWKGELREVYQCIHAHTWSPIIQKYMRTLERTVRLNSISLISKAYDVIKFDSFCELTGCSSEDTGRALVSRLNWQLDEGSSKLVKPKREKRDDQSLKGEFSDELQKLTRIISAIEN